MRIFDFDPDDHRERFSEQGWVHLPGGIGQEFFAELRDFVKREFESHHVSGRGIGGTKEQAVYEFPEAIDFPADLFDVIAPLTGLRRDSMTLSERHIKHYDADAPADPPAHKDRLSSQVSVGLSIDIPPGSRLVLYPYEHREVNPFNVSAALRESLSEEELPENLLRGAREVVIDDAAGDAVIFQGSSMWHKRRDAAGAVNLYLKLNDFGSDPLGEDPSTARLRDGTLAALADGSIGQLTPVAARRLDTIVRQTTRQRGVEVTQAEVWDANPVRIDEAELALLGEIDGARTVAELGELIGGEPSAFEGTVRRLAERGVIDLIAR